MDVAYPTKDSRLGFRFAEDLQTAEDWACFGQIARNGRAAYMYCETAWNHGHSGSRVTSNAGIIGYLRAQLKLAERIWGEDLRFLARHEREYGDTVASIHIKRARWYLSRGEASPARVDLDAAGADVPNSLRILAALPAPLLGLMGSARRLALDIRQRIS